MSIRIMSAVFESETLGPTERLIMLALADHADDAGRCYPSMARLCQRTGLGDRAIQNNLKVLVAKGYVTIVPNAGQGLANLYFISATPAPDAPPHEVRPRTKCTQTPASRSKTPAPDAPKPSRTIIEPSEEPLVVPQPDDPPPKQRRAVTLSPDWTPSDRNIADAQKAQFSAQEIDDEAQRFRDYHLAKGTAFKDWDAGWRTWLGNSRRFSAPRSTPRGQQSGTGQLFTGIAGAAMRRRAAREQGHAG